MTRPSILNSVLVACATMFLILTPVTFAADEPMPTTAQVIQLDINKASAAAIAEALEGVGLIKAREIVAYREMFGNFASVDELAEVQGIGPNTLEKNRQRIVIVGN